jgi:hypothetical protein
MPNLMESVGAQPKNPSRGKPIFPAPRFENGLFTNRSALHGTASWLYEKYGGYPDVLIDGGNMEISNKLTLIRRPGLSEWSNITVPAQPNWFYDWRTLNFGVQVIVDTPTSTYIQDPTHQTLIFTKSAGAGQGYYQGVGNELFYGDGIDLQKYIMSSGGPPPVGTVWNWGIQPGPTAPVVTITETASATVNWVANTVFPTMGLLVDSNGNIQQLISVNAQPVTNPNATQFGLTGNGQPAWNQTPGGTTTDNAWNWTNWGPIVLWTPNTLYNNASTGGTLANPCIIYDPNTKCCFIIANAGGSQGHSGFTRPNFPAGFGSSIADSFSGSPNAKWFNLGSLKTPQPWQGSHSYPSLGHVANDDSVSGIVEPVSLSGGLPSNQTVYWQVNNTGSTQTSGASGTNPPWATLTGTQTTDNQLLWLNLGTATRAITTVYFAWTAMGSVFSVIVDSNNNYQVCTTGGLSSATATGSIVWATGYGQTTVDGGVTWTCVGPKMSWAANTSWYLPTTGWFPPGGSIPYGGALITDSNGNVQAVIASGKSGGSAPVWATTPVGATTTDNAATWALVGPFTSAGFSWTKGMSYAYSYTSRAGNDIYNYAVGSVIPAFPTTVWAGAPPDWPSPLGPPTGAGTGHVGTASPLFTITGPNPGATVTLVIPGSSDPQVDTITIWRTLDGGSTLFFLTEVPNTPPIGGVQQFQTVKDVVPDTTINELITAPIADQNNPPPAGFLPMAYHFERIWGAVGNFVYSSGGPDVLTGSPNESFDPEDFFEFPSPVTRIVPTATGILVFLTSDVYAILGGPIFDTFFPTPMVPGIGLIHYNALDIHGGVTFFYTADNQFISMDPSGGAQRMGGPIADQLQNFSASQVYVTVHESGNDNCIILSNGTTGWYRLNPYQFPNGNQVWSPFATITGGAGAVLSIEVSQGVHRLLVGGIGANTFILQRDFSTYTDNGTPYTCFATIGSMNLASPGQIAGLTFANVRAAKVGTAPALSFLLNEVTGTFTPFPNSQPYPWQIYGKTGAPASIYSNAYYFRDAGVPALCEHLQIKVNFPAENFANEVFTFSLFGVIEQSPED